MDGISKIAPIWSTMPSVARELEAAEPSSAVSLTGQLENPAVNTIAIAKAELSVSMLANLRNKALDAYSEIMRISM